MASRTLEYVWTGIPEQLEDKSLPRRNLAAYLLGKYNDDRILGYRIKLIGDDHEAELEGVPEDVVAAAGDYPFVYVHVNFDSRCDRSAIVSTLLSMGLRSV